jgi:cellulose synthase (UDP-forming)
MHRVNRGRAAEAGRETYSRERFLSCVAVVACIISLGLAYRSLSDTLFSLGEPLALGLMRSVSVAILSTLIALGGFVYLITRIGYLRRTETSSVPTRAELEQSYYLRRAVPSVCITIPSYKEETHVLRQAIVSAALAEYPSRRVVVLLDDPPQAFGADLLALLSARSLVEDLHHRFHAGAIWLRAELSDFLVRRSGASGCDPRREILRVAGLYEALADWIEGVGSECVRASVAVFAHTDGFFLEHIISAPAAAHRVRASELRQAAPDIERVELEYRRLASLLNVQIKSFERKQYANLSHAPNKAMNLNSYISLMGKCYNTVTKDGLTHLKECPSTIAELIEPHADYLLTLDADSFVLSDYILKLAHIMENDQRIAVAQTPYSAIPGSPNRLERAAGAQTDLQYIVHQGFTYFDATYWVGANALLRYDALVEIGRCVQERGHTIKVFIQDRTLIEDTGSTVDLIRQGWKLHNHPQRLAYSATPPDFGSLLIQRRRWANGGLIIFADLLRYARRKEGRPPSLSELIMRSYYLCSPAIAGALIVLMILLPSVDTASSIFLLGTALPYYALSGRDLRLQKYSWADIAGVYTLSLMLVPINCAGVLRSVQQIVTGKKAEFARTPKVENRTSVPPLHVIFQFSLMVAIACCGALKLWRHEYYLAVLYGINAVFLVYGLTILLGPIDAFKDLLRHRPAQAGVPDPNYAAREIRRSAHTDPIKVSSASRS